MFKKSFILSLLASVAVGAPPEFVFDQNFNQDFPQNIVVNNRILLKINGKAISVMDVVRKMDLLFYRQYPELADSSVARYQFYSSAWRTILGAVIDDYLIVADAEEKKVTVNDGEVREELEKLFGPDVVLNLDKLGMTLQEAFELLHMELIVREMTAMMVRSRAMADVHPDAVKKKYQQYLAEHPSKKFWVYRLLSIRGQEHERVAREAYGLISEGEISFDQIAHRMSGEGIELTYSDEYRQHEGEISTAYRNVLEGLTVGNISTPLCNKNVSRLFYLKDIEKVDPPPFSDFGEQLRQELTQEAMERYNIEYRSKLHLHYGLTDKYLNQVIPKDLQPFAMR
jgi:hypothetical protein